MTPPAHPLTLQALSLLSLDDLDDLGLSLGGRRKLHAALHGQSVGASPRSARSSGASALHRQSVSQSYTRP